VSAPVLSLRAAGHALVHLPTRRAVVRRTHTLHRLHECSLRRVDLRLLGDIGEAVCPQGERRLDASARNLGVVCREAQLGVGDRAYRRAEVVHDGDRHEHRRQLLDCKLARRPLVTVRVRVVGLDVATGEPHDLRVRRLRLERLDRARERERLDRLGLGLDYLERRLDVDVIPVLLDVCDEFVHSP
jgi:putative ubiquitin-RnfH superfamily antitoxin RatB of RatAB toxin-antitoxin module